MKKYILLALLYTATLLPITVYQEAHISRVSLLLVQYLESKVNSVGRIKIKIKQMILELDRRNEREVLESILQAVGGLTLVYRDKFLYTLYNDLYEMVYKTGLSPGLSP